MEYEVERTGVPVEAVNGTELDGSLAVGHDLHAGGNATVAGNATVDKDMHVEGWLYAPNIVNLRERVLAWASGLDDDLKDWVDGELSENIEAIRALIADIVLDLANQFLSKVQDDTANGLIRFKKGIKTGTGDYGIDSAGTATLLSAICNVIQSSVFSSGLLDGKGFGLWMRDGLAHLEVDELWVRKIMHVLELEIRKLVAVGGNLCLSPAASKIEWVKGYDREHNEITIIVNGSVNPHLAYVRAGWTADDGTTATRNDWIVGDQPRCQTNNIHEGKNVNVKNHYWWRRIVAVSSNTPNADNEIEGWVEFSLIDEDEHGHDIRFRNHDAATTNTNLNHLPQAGDSMVAMGFHWLPMATPVNVFGEDFINSLDEQSEEDQQQYLQYKEAYEQNERNKQRTNVITLETTGLSSDINDVPAFRMYQGVGVGNDVDNDGYVDESQCWMLDRSRCIVNLCAGPSWINTTSIDINFKGGFEFPDGDNQGDFHPGQSIAHLGQIWFYGDSIWQCIVDSTSETPSHNSHDWKWLASRQLRTYEMQIDTDGYSDIAFGETMPVTCRVLRDGRVDVTDIVTWGATIDGVTHNGVERDSGDAAADAVWNSLHADFAGEIGISYTSERDDIRRNDGLATVFSFYGTVEDSNDPITGTLTI